MDIRATLAADAYAAARSAAAAAPRDGGGLLSFAAEFTRILDRGEAAAAGAMTGQTDPYALVQALSATELAVETAVTLRDKVVEAYQEILRMPV
jgi:flagellar hook-basal body complex protein FliE